MKKQNAKPPVAPPESHKEPTFPTLTALGILAAAGVLVPGCAGVIKQPRKIGGAISPPTEWHEPVGGYISEPSLEPETPHETAKQTLPCEYRVGSTKGGDTLSGIAKLFYGDASKWPLIWEANKPAIKNPDVIRDGMMITVPKL